MSLHKKLTGADLHAPSNQQVENTTGSTIASLRAVTFSGVGVYPKITPISSLNEVVRGVTSSAIAHSSVGYITCLGFLFNVNTNAYNINDKLYASIGGALSTIPFGLPVAYVLKKDAVHGILYVSNTGVSVDDVANAGFPADAELEMTWAVQFPIPYKEFSYNVTGDIVDYNVYADDTKAIQVFNKHFSYDLNGNLIQIVTTNLITTQSKTKDITYDLDGEMISMKES